MSFRILPIVALSLGDDAVIARIAGRLLRDHAEADRVVVAAGDQRRPRRRAERGGVEVRVAQAVSAMRSSAGVGITPPKVLGHAEADVVGHDQQDVRRALGRHDPRRPVGLRLDGRCAPEMAIISVT